MCGKPSISQEGNLPFSTERELARAGLFCTEGGEDKNTNTRQPTLPLWVIDCFMNRVNNTLLISLLYVCDVMEVHTYGFGWKTDKCYE